MKQAIITKLKVGRSTIQDQIIASPASRMIGILMLVVGELILAGWMLDRPVLYGGWGSMLPILPSTGSAFVLSGVALMALASKKMTLLTCFIVFFMGLGVSAIGFFMLLNWFTNDQFLSPDDIFKKLLQIDREFEKNSPQIALALLINGVSLALLSFRRFITSYMSQLIQVLYLMMVMQMFFGVFYNKDSFTEYSIEIGIPLHASILFTLVGIGILFARSNKGLLQIIRGDSIGGILMRYMLPVVVVSTIILGWIVNIGFERLLYSEHFAAALLVSLIVLITGSIVIALGHYINYQQSLRKKAERETLELQTNLAHIVRINSMGELASGLAHEINQPLAAISTYAAGCQRRLPKGEDDSVHELDASLELIKKQAFRATEIIKRMRGFVSKQQPTTEEANINQLLQDVLTLFKTPLYEHNIQLMSELDSTLPLIKVDAIQIGQVVLNLVQNAIHSMASIHGRKHLLQIKSSLDKNGCVQVEISDNGTGIDESLVEKIFDAFVSTKEEGGLGVGLSISRTIIEAHDGRLWMETQKHHGTVFYFTLPVSGIEN